MGMRRQARFLTAVAVVLASGAWGTTSANAAAPRTGSVGTPSLPVTSAAATPKRELVPAFDRSLPMGHVSLGPAAKPGTKAPAAAWVCTVYASDPWKSGVEIEADGWQSCSGTGYAPVHIKVTIQVYKAFGFWMSRWSYTSPWTTDDWDEATVWYDCSGDGTYTYRVVTDGWAQGGRYHQAVQSLNYLRVSC